MKSDKVYLDYAASTPVDARVVDVMGPYFDEAFGNSSSVHGFGQEADAAVENARAMMAAGIHCSPSEIVFTSCGSESDNLALRGAAFAARQIREANHILISPVEHHAVSHTAEQLAKVFDFELEYLPVDEFGRVSAEDVATRIRKDTALVSVIHANNEIGTVNAIAEIGAVCRERGVVFHTDAVQGAAHLPIDVQAMHVDLMSLGAHKFYGPKGVGALYVRMGTPLLSMQTGGGQEHGLRAGTSNTPYIAGMAEAFKWVQEERASSEAHYQALRDKLIGTILETIPDVKLSGHPTDRLPNHASFVFKGVDGNNLLMMLDMAGFACSSGSACKTGNPEPSDVLKAMGVDDEWALGSLRVTVGKQTTAEDVGRFLDVLPGLIEKNRKLSR